MKKLVFPPIVVVLIASMIPTVLYPMMTKSQTECTATSKKFQYKKENKIRMRNTGENQSPALETIKQN